MSFKKVNEYLSKLSKEDMSILIEILDGNKSNEPKLFDSTISEAMEHNNNIIKRNNTNRGIGGVKCETTFQ